MTTEFKVGDRVKSDKFNGIGIITHIQEWKARIELNSKENPPLYGNRIIKYVDYDNLIKIDEQIKALQEQAE